MEKNKKIRKTAVRPPRRRERPADIKNRFLVECYPKLICLPFLGALKQESYYYKCIFFIYNQIVRYKQRQENWKIVDRTQNIKFQSWASLEINRDRGHDMKSKVIQNYLKKLFVLYDIRRILLRWPRNLLWIYVCLIKKMQ